MAIWQYVAYLIPESSLADDGSLTGLVVTAEGFDHPPLQFAISGPELEQLVSVYLPTRESWHKDLHTWGDDEHDDFDIWYKEERIREVRVRLDLRDLKRERIKKLVHMARQANCSFLEGRILQVFPADENTLLESIRNSRSANFVRDPRGFFESLPRHPSERRPEP